jgi:hypothetical protein
MFGATFVTFRMEMGRNSNGFHYQISKDSEKKHDSIMVVFDKRQLISIP